MNPVLLEYINALDDQRIEKTRKIHLDSVVQELNKIYAERSALDLVFICTHNSRRSVLAQTWAFVAAYFFDKSNIRVYSGGTEETAVYPSIIRSLKEAGLSISQLNHRVKNPVYSVDLAGNKLELRSKCYDSDLNPNNGFVSMMTCSDADQNCPFIPNSLTRISFTFEDPKFSDGTPEEHQVYFNKSIEIANEIFYIFSLLTYEKTT